MIAPENATNVVAQMNAEQIQGAVQDRVVGLLVSIGLAALGGVCGAEIKKLEKRRKER